MRFEVDITSLNYDENGDRIDIPCEGAVLVKEHSKFHCDECHYEIEIGTLEELIEFTKKHEGRIVIATGDSDDDMPYLEIYNDYRE